MRKSCRVHINEQEFTAQRGEVLLDAALGNGIDVPHDCRAGQCGTCKVKVTAGMTIGGECDELGMVKACQARIITDLQVAVEPVPEVLTTRGTVIDTRPLAPDVMEVVIRPHDEIVYLPGQYYRFQFRGYPGRYFSPTAPMGRSLDPNALRLHVRHIPEGRVSPAIGHAIRSGHPVTLSGPYGSAYLRPGLSNRLVLVGSGTGFAPIWCIADAAMEENPWRQMMVMAAAKTLPSLYMAPAFRRLSTYPNVRLVPTVSERPANAPRMVRKGRPTDHMPRLTPDDIVYACGAPQMVDAVKDLALAAGATFYADPFTPQHGSHDDDGIVARAIAWLGTIVPLPGGAGAEQIRLLPKPQPTQPEEQSPHADRPRQHYAPPPQPVRASRPRPMTGPVRHRAPSPPHRRMPANGIPAE
jgi:NAD(P)H-flavin reductase/ferredoxin